MKGLKKVSLFVALALLLSLGTLGTGVLAAGGSTSSHLKVLSGRHNCDYQSSGEGGCHNCTTTGYQSSGDHQWQCPTSTPTSTATNTPEPTATDTTVPPTATPTNTPVPPTETSTNTPEPTATDTVVPPTDTPEPTATDTTVPPTNTPTEVVERFPRIATVELDCYGSVKAQVYPSSIHSGDVLHLTVFWDSEPTSYRATINLTHGIGEYPYDFGPEAVPHDKYVRVQADLSPANPDGSGSTSSKQYQPGECGQSTPVPPTVTNVPPTDVPATTVPVTDLPDTGSGTGRSSDTSSYALLALLVAAMMGIGSAWSIKRIHRNR